MSICNHVCEEGSVRCMFTNTTCTSFFRLFSLYLLCLHSFIVTSGTCIHPTLSPGSSEHPHSSSPPPCTLIDLHLFYLFSLVRHSSKIFHSCLMLFPSGSSTRPSLHLSTTLQCVHPAPGILHLPPSCFVVTRGLLSYHHFFFFFYTSSIKKQRK